MCPAAESSSFRLFAGLALLLSAIGLYGVWRMPQAANAGFGIRMRRRAARDVLTIVLGQGLKLV